MLLVGLTGGIGTGKSTISKILLNNGINVIDADEVAKYVVEPGRPEYKCLRRTFGDIFFDDEGYLKRKEFSAYIFERPEERRKLNKIIHPAVTKEIIWRILNAIFSFQNIVVIDVPLLFESGMHRFMHQIILVKCDQAVQVERIKKRDGFSEEEALLRINSQLSTEQKAKMSTFVIDNNDSLENTTKQVENIIQLLRNSWKPIIYQCSIIFLFCVLFLVVAFGIKKIFVISSNFL